MKKRILCFGDSNTWGWNPVAKDRYDDQTRWTRVLAHNLGSVFEIIEEGLNGRTTVWDDPIEGFKNGSKQLTPCLESHKPLDMVILMLGTNDLKSRFSVQASDIAASVGALVKMIQQSAAGIDGAAPEVLMLCPPPVGKLTELADMFFGAKEKSKALDRYYRMQADELGCAYLNMGDYIQSSDIDGIHLDADSHLKMAEILAAKIKDKYQLNHSE